LVVVVVVVVVVAGSVRARREQEGSRFARGAGTPGPDCLLTCSARKPRIERTLALLEPPTQT
jgi:hypothetical protein